MVTLHRHAPTATMTRVTVPTHNHPRTRPRTKRARHALASANARERSPGSLIVGTQLGTRERRIPHDARYRAERDARVHGF